MNHVESAGASWRFVDKSNEAPTGWTIATARSLPLPQAPTVVVDSRLFFTAKNFQHREHIRRERRFDRHAAAVFWMRERKPLRV
jgi:hypothetical protein